MALLFSRGVQGEREASFTDAEKTVEEAGLNERDDICNLAEHTCDG